MPIGEPTMPTQGREFDPHDPKYEKVADLPVEQRGNFVDVSGGFVSRGANEKLQEAKSTASERNARRPILDKFFSSDI